MFNLSVILIKKLLKLLNNRWLYLRNLHRRIFDSWDIAYIDIYDHPRNVWKLITIDFYVTFLTPLWPLNYYNPIMYNHEYYLWHNYKVPFIFFVKTEYFLLRIFSQIFAFKTYLDRNYELRNCKTTLKSIWYNSGF